MNSWGPRQRGEGRLFMMGRCYRGSGGREPEIMSAGGESCKARPGIAGRYRIVSQDLTEGAMGRAVALDGSARAIASWLTTARAESPPHSGAGG